MQLLWVRAESVLSCLSILHTSTNALTALQRVNCLLPQFSMLVLTTICLLKEGVVRKATSALRGSIEETIAVWTCTRIGQRPKSQCLQRGLLISSLLTVPCLGCHCNIRDTFSSQPRLCLYYTFSSACITIGHASRQSFASCTL